MGTMLRISNPTHERLRQQAKDLGIDGAPAVADLLSGLDSADSLTRRVTVEGLEATIARARRDRNAAPPPEPQRPRPMAPPAPLLPPGFAERLDGAAASLTGRARSWREAPFPE